MTESKALVLLSGGLDSCTCLYWAKQRYSTVNAITFNYFDRDESEKAATLRIVREAHIEDFFEIDLSFLKEYGNYNERTLVSGFSHDMRWPSYIPSRNLIFYSIAAHFSEFLGIEWIIGGHNGHDKHFFADASVDFMQKLNALLSQGSLLSKEKPYRIVLPLAGMDRKSIILLALDLGVPIDMTWSCHSKGIKHCGTCYACRQRISAFKSLGLKDPVFQ